MNIDTASLGTCLPEYWIILVLMVRFEGVSVAAECHSRPWNAGTSDLQIDRAEAGLTRQRNIFKALLNSLPHSHINTRELTHRLCLFLKYPWRREQRTINKCGNFCYRLTVENSNWHQITSRYSGETQKQRPNSTAKKI